MEYAGAIASIVASVLTLIGVIVTVEHGNRVRDVKIDDKLDLVRSELKNDVSLIRTTVTSLEKKQDAYNNVIQRMYEAERNISMIQQHQLSQDEDIRDCKRALSSWAEMAKK